MRRLRDLLFQLGGLLLVAGAALPLFHVRAGAVAFALGALLYAPLQLADRPAGRSLTLRRLYRQRQLSDLLLLVAAALLVAQAWNAGPFRRGEWMIVLSICVVVQLYSVFRIDHELNKEQKTDNND